MLDSQAESRLQGPSVQANEMILCSKGNGHLMMTFTQRSDMIQNGTLETLPKP